VLNVCIVNTNTVLHIALCGIVSQLIEGSLAHYYTSSGFMSTETTTYCIIVHLLH